MEYEVTVKIRVFANSGNEATEKVQRYMDSLDLNGITVTKVIAIHDSPKPVFPVGLARMGYTEEGLDKDNPHTQWMQD